MKRTKLGGLFMLSLLCITGYAQNYNYEYINTENYSVIQPLGKSLVKVNDDGALATAYSFFRQDNTRDCQVTFIKETGDVWASYAFGIPGRHERAHGMCKSLDYDDQYLVCGQTSNEQFLVFKTTDAGDLIWSKEIRFSFEFSEAVTIFPVNNNPYDKGYVIVGNTRSSTGENSVAVAKIKENGSLVWASEYNMGEKISMTDAIARSIYNDRVISITGFRQFGGIFYLNLYAFDGAIFYYPGATYSLPSPTSLTNPQLTEGKDNGEDFTIITFQEPSISANTPGHYAFRIDGYDDFAVEWGKYYSQPGTHGYTNGDLITLSTNRVAIGGSMNTISGSSQVVSPYVLDIDFDGNLTDKRDYDIDQFELMGSMVETVNNGYVSFNAYNLNYGVQWDIRMLKKESAVTLDCFSGESWGETNQLILEDQLDITMQYVGSLSDYPLDVEELFFDRFNCHGDPMAQEENQNELQDAVVNEDWTTPSLNQAGDNTEELTFHPNPANGQITFANSTENIQIKIVDLSGKRVLSTDLNGSLTLDISSLSDGVYLIEQYKNGDKVKREKLIVRH